MAVRTIAIPDEEHACSDVNTFESAIEILPDTHTCHLHLVLFGRLRLVDPLFDFSHEPI